MNIILTGATGLVGTAALSHILSLPARKISHLYILSRSPVPLAENHPNITVIQHSDFTNYSPDLLHKLKGAHGCIWALGVSQTQVSKEEYVRITVDYPLAAAKAFAALNDSFNFVYVSGEGATSNPGIFTPFFGRVKGNCETALIELSKKYPSLKPYSVRPAFVDATHDPKVKDTVLQRPDQQTFVKRVLRNGVVSIVRATWSDVISPTKELGLFLTNLAGGDGKPLSEQGHSHIDFPDNLDLVPREHRVMVQLYRQGRGGERYQSEKGMMNNQEKRNKNTGQTGGHPRKSPDKVGGGRNVASVQSASSRTPHVRTAMTPLHPTASSLRGSDRGHFILKKTRIPRSRPIPKSSQDLAIESLKPYWQSWESLAVNLFAVPNEVNAFMIWRAFKSQGKIISIDLYENDYGLRNGKGRVRFKPPPEKDFWTGKTWKVELLNGRSVSIQIFIQPDDRTPGIPSLAQPKVFYPSELELPIYTLEFGPLIAPKIMLSLRRLERSPYEDPKLVLDLRRRELLVFFQTTLNTSKRAPGELPVYSDFRITVPFAKLTTIYQTHNQSSKRLSHIISFDSPPVYHRHLHNAEISFDCADTENNWRAMDCWYRQTDIVHRHPEWPKLPVSLRKTNPIIDIGRWTTLRITYNEDTVDSRRFASLHEALRDFNIEIKDDDEFKIDIPKVRPVPVIWDVCDEPEGTRSASAELMGDSYVLLPFSIRYQLEVCISNGFISEYAATNEAFVHRLKDTEERKALALLEHVATDKKVYWNPMEIFDILFPKASTRRKIPAYCCMMRATTITPTMVYWDTPSMEITNRVIRNFSQYSDRFLRVRFKGEKLEGRINSTNHNTMDEIFTRIKRTMSNGIKLGNRKYEFLAFGNSQFREHGAYFFASDAHISAAQIRGWMGEFSDIRNIAKYAARIGQCFSTTRAIYTCSVQLQRIHDVTRGAYTFSDGVGRMSRFLAQMTQQELHIKTPDRDPPSAYQFRLGGCKGMLVLSSQARGQEIHIRPSQEKFPAEHQGLEVIRWSQFSMATLNRQLISVLSSLGVSDSIFHQKLQKMLSSLEEITKDDKAAMSLLQKYIDPNEMTLTISQMVSDGFLVVQEPFLVSLLSLWRAWQIKYLKEKAKIVIDGGACVLGVMDETGTLQGFSNEKIQNIGTSHEDRLSALPEIFLKVYRADEKKYCVIEGVCLLARNPSLHPGDIRVVKAVNKRELGDLKDVVVLPQLGDRDIASMCSGGDLDGDDYLVIWDQDLIPEDWFRTPMDYTPVKGVNLDRPVTVNDVTSFFVNYMKNDCLPKIAHAHMAWSDLLPRGVEEIKCIRLAKLHSDAVDYNKTGQPAYLSRELRPRKWPHFMEKNYKPKDQIYTSKKILGQLYDAVDRVDFYPDFEMPFDPRILESGIVVKDELVEFSKELKVSYDLTMRRIMAQQEIRTEFEVWSTFVLNHANQSKDYKFHEELGRISKSLRDRFQGECYDKIGSRKFEHVAPLVVAMYKVTSDEVTAALVEFHSTNPSPDLKPKINSFPMISFAWLFPDILGRIALRYFEDSDPALVNPAVDTQATELKAGKETGGVKIDQDVEKVTTLITDDLISLFDDPLSEASLEQSLENQITEEDVNLVEDEADIMPSAIDSLQNMLHDSDEDNLYDP